MIIREVTIMCDVCSDWIRVSPAKRGFRRVAQDKGWFCGAKRDLCPVCDRDRRAWARVQRAKRDGEGGGT